MRAIASSTNDSQHKDFDNLFGNQEVKTNNPNLTEIRILLPAQEILRVKPSAMQRRQAWAWTAMTER
jgi:hypothetical protein